MSIVIFGGDRLGKIPSLLKAEGFHLVHHVTGRKKSDIRVEIPREAEGVLVLVDYLNHTLALEVKAAAKRRGVQAVFARRSWSEISKAIGSLKAGPQESLR